jgi:hypothetical protein
VDASVRSVALEASDLAGKTQKKKDVTLNEGGLGEICGGHLTKHGNGVWSKLFGSFIL